MEKKIVIIMKSNKDIDVLVNNETKLTIAKTSRTIKADLLYNILDYSRGDIYTIEKSNEQSIDVPVLDFFFDLFSDICQRINSLSTEKQEDLIMEKSTEQEDQQSTNDIFIFDNNTNQAETDELPF